MPSVPSEASVWTCRSARPCGCARSGPPADRRSGAAGAHGRGAGARSGQIGKKTVHHCSGASATRRSNAPASAREQRLHPGPPGARTRRHGRRPAAGSSPGDPSSAPRGVAARRQRGSGRRTRSPAAPARRAAALAPRRTGPRRRRPRMSRSPTIPDVLAATERGPELAAGRLEADEADARWPTGPGRVGLEGRVIERLHGCRDRAGGPGQEDRLGRLERSEVERREDRRVDREGGVDCVGVLDARPARGLADHRAWPGAAPRRFAPRAGRRPEPAAPARPDRPAAARARGLPDPVAARCATTRPRFARACAARAGVARYQSSPAASATPTDDVRRQAIREPRRRLRGDRTRSRWARVDARTVRRRLPWSCARRRHAVAPVGAGSDPLGAGSGRLAARTGPALRAAPPRRVVGPDRLEDAPLLGRQPDPRLEHVGDLLGRAGELGRLHRGDRDPLARPRSRGDRRSGSPRTGGSSRPSWRRGPRGLPGSASRHRRTGPGSRPGGSPSPPAARRSRAGAGPGRPPGGFATGSARRPSRAAPGRGGRTAPRRRCRRRRR